MKKVMVFGTFDIFHRGHESFLQQARQQGDFLIAVMARDETVKKIKKRQPQNNINKRLLAVKNSQLADKVILGNLGDKYTVIKKYRPDIICLGYDQKAYVDKLKDKLQEFGLKNTKIKKLKPFHPEKYKSSLLGCFPSKKKLK
jgi:FAD synthetase